MAKNKNELVVKDNALINAAYTLNLAEQRLIILAAATKHQNQGEITVIEEIKISASEYAKKFNISNDAAYKALRSATENLFERYFRYKGLTKKGNIEVVKSRWVSQISYIENEGVVSMVFAPAVIPLISNLKKHFTSYEIKQVSNLSSTYAIRLYELLASWKSTLKTPILELAEFREKLGVEEGEYQRMHHFKARVLDVALTQINASTNILANYEQHKAGRKITGFSFSFSYKKDAQVIESQYCNKTISFVDEQNLTAKQLGYYAKLLSQSHWATQARVLQGVNSSDAVSVLVNYLKQSKNLEKQKDLIAKLMKEDKAKNG